MSESQLSKLNFFQNLTGYYPDFKYRLADTYEDTNEKLLIDASAKQIANFSVSNRCYDDFHSKRLIQHDLELLKAHESRGDPVYQYPMIPGYEGFIPNYNCKVGQRFSIASNSAIAELEKFKQDWEHEKRFIAHRMALEEKNTFIRSLGERSLSSSYRFPLETLRPECNMFAWKKFKKDIPQPPPLPYSKNTPPHFMGLSDPEKYIKSGFMGHVPYAREKVGQNNKTLTNSALVDFTNNYFFRKSNEWAPLTNFGIQCFEPPSKEKIIYSKTTGLIPHYAGHVPGAVYRIGGTFGNNTINAKQWVLENPNYGY